MKLEWKALLLMALAASAGASSSGQNSPPMALVPAGSYTPLYVDPKPPGASGALNPTTPTPAVKSKRSVTAFQMAVHAVTQQDYLEFVKKVPRWQRQNVKRIFADKSYLRDWPGNLNLNPKLRNRPVTNVSWFAAKAYCESVGASLPTVDQWEYAASRGEKLLNEENDSAIKERLRDWYSQPTPKVLPPVESTYKNAFGIWDLHGLIWEWTLDFNTAMVTGESRGDSSLEKNLYCGSGAASATDFKDYAAFMRFAFRSSLKAHYTSPNLGFRCVKSAEE